MKNFTTSKMEAEKNEDSFFPKNTDKNRKSGSNHTTKQRTKTNHLSVQNESKNGQNKRKKRGKYKKKKKLLSDARRDELSKNMKLKNYFKSVGANKN